MEKVTIRFYPDMRKILANYKIETTLDECFSKIKAFCEECKDTLRRAEVIMCDEDNKPMLMFCGSKESYRLDKKYKYLEPMVLEIYEEYFKNAKKMNVKSITVEELKNKDVIINGYIIPQDYAYGPNYSKRCRLCEAYAILEEYVRDFPEEFYNLQFHVSTEDEEYLFCIRRDLETIHLSDDNEYALTKDMIRQAMGMK